MGALLYSLKALDASGSPTGAELGLRLAKVPKHLREPVTLGVTLRLKQFGIVKFKKPNQARQPNPVKRQARIRESLARHGGSDR
jgi:hypothetical protein